MNQGGPQQVPGGGQANGNNGPAPGAVPTAQQPQRVMYKPEQMRNIKELRPEEKEAYENGLRSLWKTFNESPDGSTEKEGARRKIFDFAPVLARKVRERRALAAQIQQQQRLQQQQGQQGQGLQQGQAQGQDQQQARLAAGGQAGAAANAGAGRPGVTPAGPQQEHQGQPHAGMTQQRRQQTTKLPHNIQQHLNQLTYLPLPSLADKPPEVVAKWQEDVKKKLGLSLTQIEVTRTNIVKLDNAMKARLESGQLTAEEQKNWKDRRDVMQKVHDDAARFINSYRKQQDAAKAQLQQRQQQLQQAGGANAVSQQQQQQQQQQQAAAVAAAQQQNAAKIKTEQTNLQNSQANINGAIEAAKKESIAAAARQGAGGVAMTGNNSNSSNSNNNNNNNNNNAGASAQNKPGTIQQTPIPPPVIPAAAMQQAQKQQQHQQQPTQTPVPPPPTPINTGLAAASKAAGMGTPTPGSAARVATPHSANPLNAAPRALSHQKALEEANKQRASSISAAAMATPQPIAPAGSASSAAGGVAPSPQQQLLLQQQQQHLVQQQQQQHLAHQQQAAAAAAAAAAAHNQHGTNGAGGSAYAEVRLPTKLPDKLPIPKQLSEKSTQLPQPVALGGGVAPGRPTLTGGGGIVGGVMGQPAVAKVPTIQMEGEGERVLNKKKLDELVRQVCGGTAEGHEGNLLQPEVEESVLNLADSFVDNVLHSACRNAKERGSKVLEIRDIQLVLERTYNIRIPGYSSDELRTVRKVQPSLAWITKMSVIQAAKVTSGSKNDS